MSVRDLTRVLVAGVAIALSAACGGSANLSASAKANGEGVEADARFGEGGGDQWAGEDETDNPLKRPRAKKGRDVEGHAWDTKGKQAKATLPGFEVFRDGTSRVFLEVSGNVPVKETQSDYLLTYRFQGVKVPEKVNMLSLPTQYFNTPVSLVELRSADGDAELLVHLREKAHPKVHLKRDDSGTVLSVDFPPWLKPRRDARQEMGDHRPGFKPAPAPEK